MKILNNNKGFTLIELLLSIVITGAIFGIAAETMIRQAESYSFITNRKTSIADVRFAMNRISHDILRLESSDIQDIGATSISFTAEDGSASGFTLGADGSDLAIYRGGDILVPNVSTFNIEYQTGTGDVIDPEEEQIVNVRRIKITIITEPVGGEAPISLSTTVIPRSFIGYANFQ